MKHIKLFENWMKYISDEPQETNFSGQGQYRSERTIQKGQRVEVFRNLQTSIVKSRWEKEGVEGFKDTENVLLSIRDAKSKKTLHHSYNVWLDNCEFKVTEGKFNFKWDEEKQKYGDGSGRKGVLQQSRKNVHAFVVGDLITWDDFNFDVVNDDNTWVKLFYNPYIVDRFVVADTPENRQKGLAKKEIFSAEEVIMGEDRHNGRITPLVYAKNPKVSNEEYVMENPTVHNWKEVFDREEKEYHDKNKSNK
jgi:hypothetical protein